MPAYSVEVIRYAYGFYNTVVEARNRAEAEEAALEEAYNHEFTTASADYEVWEAKEVE